MEEGCPTESTANFRSNILLVLVGKHRLLECSAQRKL